MRLINIDDIMRMFPNADINADALDNLQAYPYWKTDITGLINILKQTPTVEIAEDCISREDAINELKLAYFNKDLQSAKDDPCIVDAMTDWAIRIIRNLPSVQPQSKTLSDAEINTFVDSMKNMRKATKEESKSTVEYIDSISKPTGFLFDEAYEELVFVEPHKKLSTNLQPCEDCIRELIREFDNKHPALFADYMREFNNHPISEIIEYMWDMHDLIEDIKYRLPNEGGAESEDKE